MTPLLCSLWLALVAWFPQEVAAPPPATSAEARAAVRASWSALAPEERADIERAWGRWKRLGKEDRAVMTRRHERLERARARARELPADEAPRGLSRREANRRALADLREVWDELPRDLRRGFDGPPGDLPLEQRQRRLKLEMVGYLQFALLEQLRPQVERGELREDEVAALAHRIQETPNERTALLRQFIVDHPQAFRVAPEVIEKVRNAADPGSGLRLLDKARRRRGGERPLLPPFPRPPHPPRGPGNGNPDEPREPRRANGSA